MDRDITVAEAQEEVRVVYLNGSVGALVSAVLWITSTAFATWGSKRQAVLTIVLGGMFLFPANQLLLRLSGRPATLRPGNPLKFLAMQIAFTIPLMLPVVGGASLYNNNWFYPGCAVVVGAHYLPFVFLYGMW
jgi:formate/nitrite transporter FocA (FNT family)